MTDPEELEVPMPVTWVHLPAPRGVEMENTTRADYTGNELSTASLDYMQVALLISTQDGLQSAVARMPQAFSPRTASSP